MNDKLTAQVTFRVTKAQYRALQATAEHERRKMNEVARALLERGCAAYERDGELFEPKRGGKSLKDETIIAEGHIDIGKKEIKKRNFG